jgi:hypothetical protein
MKEPQHLLLLLQRKGSAIGILRFCGIVGKENTIGILVLLFEGFIPKHSVSWI